MKRRIEMAMLTAMLALCGTMGWGTTYYVADQGGAMECRRGLGVGVEDHQQRRGEAGSGGTVVVSNGTYTVTTNVVMGNVTVQSLNGRDVTFVNGNYPHRQQMFLSCRSRRDVSGFTISNGAGVGFGVSGGGAVYITNGAR